MPVHRIADAMLEGTVTALEKSGEHVVQIATQPENAAVWVVITTAAPKAGPHLVSTSGPWQERVA